MGQCVSVVPAKAVPQCRVCKTEGPAPWSRMDSNQRAAWIWQGNESVCRKCLVSERLAKDQYEKDRQRYKKAKEEMYPRISDAGKPSLRRLKSGERWDSSSSFHSGWRPPSSLRRLLSAIKLAQAEDPKQYVGMQRKPTGFVPASTPAALPVGAASIPAAAANGVGVKHADASEVADLTAADVERQREEEHIAASQRQLAALEEELEVVEEEDFCEHSRSRGLGTLQEEDEVEGEGEVERRGTGAGDTRASVLQSGSSRQRFAT